MVPVGKIERAAASFLVVGEALIDVIAQNGARTRVAGGSALNVAVALGRLGEAVTLQTAIGRDADAELIAAHLAESDVTLCATRLDHTSTAAATIGADGAATYSFDIQWMLDPALSPRADHLHTGSIAMFLDPGADTVAELVESGRHATVSLDPNVRPSLLPPPAEARRRFERLLPYTDIVKLSDEDAAWLYPDQPPEHTLQTITDAGASLVALTQGSRGAQLRCGAQFVQVSPIAVRVADTVGAGDTFMAGLLSGLRREDPGLRADRLDHSALERVGRFAATAAALCVTKTGASPPSIAELRAHLN